MPDPMTPDPRLVAALIDAGQRHLLIDIQMQWSLPLDEQAITRHAAIVQAADWLRAQAQRLEVGR